MRLQLYFFALSPFDTKGTFSNSVDEKKNHSTFYYLRNKRIRVEYALQHVLKHLICFP